MKDDRHGAALLLAIGYLAILSTFAGAYLAGVHRTVDGFHRAERIQTARALAEAGVDRAIVMLKSDPAYAGEEDLVLGEGTVTIVVSTSDSGTTITSTGVLIRSELDWPQRLEVSLSTGATISSWEWV